MKYLSLKRVAFEQSGVTAALRKGIFDYFSPFKQIKKKKKTEITERGRKTAQVKKGGKEVCTN